LISMIFSDNSGFFFEPAPPIRSRLVKPGQGWSSQKERISTGRSPSFALNTQNLEL
jgi:hypothetical protein